MEFYTESQPLQANKICSLTQTQLEQGYFCAGFREQEAILLWVLEGTYYSGCNGRTELLQPGDMVVYAPNQWHMGYGDIHSTPSLLCVAFSATGSAPSAGTRYRSPAASALLKQLLEETQVEDAYAAPLQLALLTQLLLLWQREVSGSEAPLSGEQKIILRTQQIISDHARQRLSVPLVAQKAGVSPSYLTALFQKHLQLSPGEYIRRVKLQESKQMIRENQLNFTQIAAALEYSTVHHFSRQFKEKFGITPSQYAKNLRQT